MLKLILWPIIMFVQQEHVTMTTIENVPGTDSLKVIINYNFYEFLKDYQQTLNDDIDIEVFRNQKPFPTDLSNNYVNSKISINVNGKPLLGKLLKMEKTGENINLLVLYRLKKGIRILKVRNTILTGLHSNIENLTILKIDDFEKGIKFTQQHPEETFSFK
jgi:hypothetical protein